MNGRICTRIDLREMRKLTSAGMSMQEVGQMMMAVLMPGPLPHWATDKSPKPRRNSGRLHPFVWAQIKARVIERDGLICVYCGKLVTHLTLHIDHVVPISRGGGNSMENLCVACKKCNLAKGAKMDWKACDNG